MVKSCWQLCIIMYTKHKLLLQVSLEHPAHQRSVSTSYDTNFSPHKPAWPWLYKPYQWCQSRAVCTCMLFPRILGNHERPWHTHTIIMLYYTICSRFLFRGESSTWNLFFPLGIITCLLQRKGNRQWYQIAIQIVAISYDYSVFYGHLRILLVTHLCLKIRFTVCSVAMCICDSLTLTLR